MEILLFAFANNREHPLKTLADEYLSVNKILSPRVLRQHFLSWAISHASLDDIAYYLTLFRDQLALFQYSGHAGRDVLLTENGASRAEGITHLLKQCKNLKVVVLNGCSTAGQIKVLHEAGIPLIIATSAPVEDEAATRFSARLYQALETGLTIGESFELAVGETLAGKSVNIFRDLGFEEAPDQVNSLWGIFQNPQTPDAHEWKLPVQISRSVAVTSEPNEFLLETLFETFATSNHRVNELQSSGATLEDQKEEVVSALLKALPAPISEQLRKLVAPSAPGAADGWDKIGAIRLEQLNLTYQISMDFLVFALLAQIWETLLKAPEPFVYPEVLRKDVSTFLHLSAEKRNDCDYFSFIRVLRDSLDAYEASLFIKEFKDFETTFTNDENIKTACFFLETLRRQGGVYSVSEMEELCMRAEKSLAAIFSKLGFLGKYALATVRNIDVMKYRHTEKAQFEHLVMKWHGSMGYYEKEYRRQPEFMDNRSVVLLRIDDAPGSNQFLNLSPFIIDENTFETTPDLSVSKLYFFARYDGNRLFYKYVNDPETDIIDLDNPDFFDRKKKTGKFQLAKDQFMAFFESILSTQPR